MNLSEEETAEAPIQEQVVPETNAVENESSLNETTEMINMDNNTNLKDMLDTVQDNSGDTKEVRFVGDGETLTSDRLEVGEEEEESDEEV